jgi:phosphohistidine swiveling domain-containing protein
MVEGQVYIGEGSLAEMRTFLDASIHPGDTKFLSDFSDRCYERLAALSAIAQRISGEQKQGIADADILELFQRYIADYRDVCTFIPIFRAIGNRIEQILMLMLEDARVSNATEKMYYLTQPTKETEGLTEHAQLLGIADHIKRLGLRDFRSDATVRSLAEKHVEQFYWLGLQWYTGSPLQLNDMFDRLDNLLRTDPSVKLTNLRNRQERSEREIQKLVDGHQMSEGMSTLARFAQDYAFLRSYRADVVNQCVGLIFEFLARIASQLGLDYEGLIYLVPEEVVAHLQGTPVDREVILSRKNGFGSLLIDEEYSILSGLELQQFKESEGLNLVPRIKSEVKGIVACQGKAQGRVKVVRSMDDLSKVQVGDILVAVMTYPAYMAAMERAAAFVTDDGGILCHAAIIARELGKPCVIGTHGATESFRDGDLVDVDAEGDEGCVSGSRVAYASS